MATEILSLGQTTLASSEIIVDGVAKVVCLKYDNTIDISKDIRLSVQIKNNNNQFQNLFSLDRGQVCLGIKNMCVTLTENGTYRIYRKDITVHGINLGAELND